MQKKRFIRLVGSEAPIEPGKEKQPDEFRLTMPRRQDQPPMKRHADQTSPDDLGDQAKRYNLEAEYIPLAPFLASLPENLQATLADLRTEGMRAAQATLKAGLPVKKLPHDRFGAVFCYPRHVLQALYAPITPDK